MTTQPQTYTCGCGHRSRSMLENVAHIKDCDKITGEDKVTLLKSQVGRKAASVEAYTPPVSPGKDIGNLIGIPKPAISDSPWKFTKAGEEIISELLIIAQDPNLPVELRGRSGCGKSVAVREVARRLGNRPNMAINAHPGMDISLLVGGMHTRPLPQGGITVEWADGDLTTAIKEGIVFFFEEATRAPQEMVSRLFGLLDQGFGYWNIPEAGIRNVPIHKDFWFVATSNPAGMGYQTTRLDAALQSRLAVCFDIDEPLADERAILTDLLAPTNSQDGHDMVDRFIHFAIDTRRKDAVGIDVGVNTRDLISAATLVNRSFDPLRAITLTISNKYPESRDVLDFKAITHFNGEIQYDEPVVEGAENAVPQTS
jgi:MoxR-like ATPase